ncbi:S9 family peptidase [Aquimarina sp. TRL1]|uniref:alpha/beta hydrolase family protein n=1 Tax=Aquimarina sp. (strain TRL1) TaxID=2736252 RepID=UPI0015888C33|nr:prolyl oligopeptidase family serine peptidase [Aquimarina sp. TRL1]QKX07285.1 S9 family peptidase [Aquimarina sp. TRL1]
MIRFILLLLFTLISFFTGNSQETSLLLKQEIIPFSKIKHYEKFLSRFPEIEAVNSYNITYLSDGLKVKGVLVLPKKEGQYPTIIYNRGGNRDTGAISPKAIPFLGLAKIASKGYVVIASQYRGNMGGEGKEEFGGQDVNDVLNLLNVIKEIKQADTTNVGMYGWSRGGMMTYIALTKTNRIKAAAVGGAVSNNFETITDRPIMEEKVLAELIPEYSKHKETELKKRSATFWAHAFPKDTPLLIMHGTSDWRVKPSQSLQLAIELDKHRKPYRLIMFEGGDHGIRNNRKEVSEQVIQWFDRFLKQGEKVPNMEFHGK